MKTKTYRQRAAALRAVGFKITLGAKGGSEGDLSRKKAAVTRAWKRVGHYLENGTHKFIPATRKQKADFASRKTRSPGGFFQPIPAGVSPSKIRYKLTGRVLTQRVHDRETGQIRTDQIVRLDARKIAGLGADYVNELTLDFRSKNPNVTFRLMVNGWDGKNPYNPKDLEKYLVEVFLPKLRKAGLTRKQVNDIFHLKMISFSDQPEAGELGEYDDDEDSENEPF